MRVVVAGGAGFIGSNFIRYVVRTLEWEVLVYDKLTYAGRMENLKDVIERIVFVKGDIADEEKIEEAFRRFEPDLIVNFAAETHVDRSINEPAPFIQTNIIGVFKLLEVLRRYDNVKLLHISTDEVYGDLYDVQVEVLENSPLNPSNPYSASKACGDLLIKAYGRTYSLNYWIIRPCNNYGPYQHPEKLIPRTIIRLLLGKPAIIYGDGSQIRDWLYVEDTVRAIVEVVIRGNTGEVYNVCANNYRTVREVVESIVKLMNKDLVKDVVYSGGRPGEDRKYAMNCGKIRELGWKPLTTFEEGLSKTIKWYLSNEWWWRSVIDERYVLANTPW